MTQVATLPPDESNTGEITEGSSGMHNAGTILFRDNQNGEFFLGNADGTELRSLISNRDYLGVSLSPQGDRLAYWFNGFLFTRSVLSGETFQINQDPIGSHQSGQLVWSPDIQNIAFDCVLADPEHSDLCIMNIATGTYGPLTDFKLEPSNGVALGSWSADGNWIVFIHEHFPEQGFAEGELQLIDLESGEIRTLYDERDYPEISFITHSTISPNGKVILFQANANGVPEIFSIDPSTSEVRQVTESDNEYGTTWPVWNPSGESFFASTAFENEEGEIELQPALISLDGELL